MKIDEAMGKDSEMIMKEGRGEVTLRDMHRDNLSGPFSERCNFLKWPPTTAD
jgi:hypothetical protein